MYIGVDRLINLKKSIISYYKKKKMLLNCNKYTDGKYNLPTLTSTNSNNK